MTRYLLLNLLFLGFILLVAKLWGRQGLTKPVLLTMAPLLVLTAIFDSLIIYAQIVGYNRLHILGWYIWRAPIEDFIYAIVSVLLVSSLWEYYASKDTKKEGNR